MADIARRPRHRAVSLPSIVALAVLSAALMFTVAAFTQPSSALGYTHTIRVALCDGVALRAKPKASSNRKARIKAGTEVKVVAKVSGGKWSTKCGGKSSSGKGWFKITYVAGKSVKSLYGVPYVYAAAGLFKKISIFKVAACDGVSLRVNPKTGAKRKAVINSGTAITAASKVSGGSWSVSCNGKTSSGKGWFKIKKVEGQSVSSLYGVSYVYAAAGLFKKPSTATPEPETTPPPPDTDTLTEGIDVSHWQGTIDWTKVSAAGKKFVYIKASESRSFVDKKYATNRSLAKANGLFAGAYHFAQPDADVGDAAAEADHFIKTAAWTSGDLLPVLDLEVTGGLDPAALTTWVKQFVRRIYNKTGVRAVIYVSPSFWSNRMGNTQWFANNGYRVLWVAHWTTASEPTVPAGNWGTYGWTFWQYTSKGSVPGISGNVDLNRYRGTDFKPVRVP